MREQPRNAGTALAQTLVDELARCGVGHACLAPGSRSSPLAVAFAEHEDIAVHVEIDERSAAFLGLGLGMATRRPAAVLCTSGTAAANFFPAVVEAAQARVPLIVVTADRPPELRHTGANQTIDQIKLYGRFTRWFCELGTPENRPGQVPYWRSVVCRAVAAALGGPPGPVHLNVGLREPLTNEPDAAGFDQDISGRAGGKPWTRHRPGPRRPPDEMIAEIAARFGSASRGLVVAGAGVRAPDGVRAFAERAGWPLLADTISGARCGPNAIASYDLLLASEEFAAEMRPDIILRVGNVQVSKSLLRWLSADVEQVLIDPDGESLDGARAVSEIVAGDPAETLEAIAKALPAPEDGAWLEGWQSADKTAEAAVEEVLQKEPGLSEPEVAQVVVQSVPHGTTIAVASSMPVRDLNTCARPRPGLEFISNRGASGIDGFVSTSLGAAIGSQTPVVALSGDLSLLHDQNGFLLAERDEIDATFVVLNNDGGGIFSLLPQARNQRHFETLFGTPHGTSFERLAAMYGLGYVRARDTLELRAALDRFVGQTGVGIVEIRTDRRANAELHLRLRHAVIHALSGR